MKRILLVAVFLLSACGVPATASSTPEGPLVKVYASSAAQPWLAKLYDCGTKTSSTLLTVPEPQSADIALRLGEPDNLTTPAFQVDTDELLVVVNQVHPFNRLTEDQVRGLFTGQISDWSQIDASKTGPVQVWVYAAGEDVQQVFARTLAGSPIVSTARLATSPEAMSQAIADDQNAIGILSRHWKMGNVADVYTATSAPVLAITSSEPQGVVKDLLACLQR